MKLEINPNNRKYYSDDFIKGFECGVERQFAENKESLEKLIDEFEKSTENNNFKNEYELGKYDAFCYCIDRMKEMIESGETQ